ncbi:MAG: SPOR domain-containing protein [Zetaproteobacteria bacterium]|nr:MAG: SPOR domain-containing protein [Zetaproteobacteria bacterium]
MLADPERALAGETEEAPPPRQAPRVDERRPVLWGVVIAALLAMGAVVALAWRVVHDMEKEVQRLHRKVGALARDVAELRASEARLARTLATFSAMAAQRADEHPTQPAAKAQSDSGQTAALKPEPRHAAARMWTVNLVSTRKREEAEAFRRRLLRDGHEAEIRRVQLHGVVWYRVRVGRFADRSKARAAQRALARAYHLRDAWISPRD